MKLEIWVINTAAWLFKQLSLHLTLLNISFVKSKIIWYFGIHSSFYWQRFHRRSDCECLGATWGRNSYSDFSWTSDFIRSVPSEFKYLLPKAKVDACQVDLLVEAESTQIWDINLQSSRSRADPGDTSNDIIASFTIAEFDCIIVIVISDWQYGTNTFINFGSRVWSASVIAHISWQ